jgi:hypothetical protein
MMWLCNLAVFVVCCWQADGMRLEIWGTYLWYAPYSCQMLRLSEQRSYMHTEAGLAPFDVCTTRPCGMVQPHLSHILLVTGNARQWLVAYADEFLASVFTASRAQITFFWRIGANVTKMSLANYLGSGTHSMDMRPPLTCSDWNQRCQDCARDFIDPAQVPTLW